MVVVVASLLNLSFLIQKIMWLFNKFMPSYMLAFFYATKVRIRFEGGIFFDSWVSVDQNKMILVIFIDNMEMTMPPFRCPYKLDLY